MSERLREELKSSFTTHWSYMALRAACRLDLFEELLRCPSTVKDLAAELRADNRMLGFLCAHLHREGFLEKRDEIFHVTGKGVLLTESHPESVKHACILWGAEQLDALQDLEYTLRTGESAFERQFGRGFFGFIAGHPDSSAIYHRAMGEYARDDYRSLPDRFDFSGYIRILDVGGGTGVLAGYIWQRHPNAQVFVLDRPDVLSISCAPGVHPVAGDFFQPIDGEFDAVVLARVLHDWDDERAQLILQRVSGVQRQGDSLLVLENLTDRMKDGGELLSLHMAAVCQSHERSFDEYKELLDGAGYDVAEPISLTSNQYILPCTKR